MQISIPETHSAKPTSCFGRSKSLMLADPKTGFIGFQGIEFR